MKNFPKPEGGRVVFNLSVQPGASKGTLPENSRFAQQTPVKSARSKRVCFQHIRIRILCHWLLFGMVGLLVSSLSLTPAIAAIPYPRDPAAAPPDCYLDVPFLPTDSGLNRFMLCLDNHGVKPFVKYWGDFLANPVGGVEQRADYYQLLLFGVKLDLERLMGWQGGEMVLSAVDAGGDNIENSVGTKFLPSQAITFPGFALFCLYYTQHLFDDKVELEVGRASTGGLYATLPIMGLPVSGAVCANPLALGYNTAGFHATGRANWMANIKVKPTANTYLQSGIFQVTTDRMNTLWYNGVDFSFRRGDGVLLMAEAGWSPCFRKEEGAVSEDNICPGQVVFSNAPFQGLPGLYQVGSYYQNYPMPTFLGDNSVQNAYGFYCQAQQMLWRSRLYPTHNFTIWGGITYSPQIEIALMPVMAYGGVAWSGLIPTRDNDQLLLNYYVAGYSRDYSLSCIHQGNGSRTVETSFELSYIFQLTRQIQLQPDFQWFLQPGGTKNIPNAFVLGAQISFVY